MIPIFYKGWLGGRTSLTLSSTMGRRWGRMHNGVDIGVPVNTRIMSPVDGRVTKVANQPHGAGRYIKVRFYSSASVYYDVIFMHLNRVVVSKGATVRAGQHIANSGNTGRSTGPHVHLEIRKGGMAVNPVPFLSERVMYRGKLLSEGRAYASLPENIDSPASNYTGVDITNSVDGNAIEQDVITTTTTKVGAVGDRLAPGIWQITKLLMDSSVQNRQIFDSSIALQTGPLSNFFRKVCQLPFVELSGDTYGDQYYFMVRKPPYDKEGMLMMMETFDIDIDEREIISTNIGWATDGIYSWYQLIPYGELMGSEQQMLYMPAIFFPEYAAIWGSKELTIQSQYVNFYLSGYFNQNTDKKKKQNGENIIKNAVRDLKYLVESNAYIPFTRQGTITLNGDRRIKRGSIISMPNGEQFYVDSVANNLSFSETSVHRTTTLTVSHGMFPEYINGVEVNGEIMSYFNIIDFGKDFDVSNLTVETWRKAFSNWKVNVNVFAYFLKRSQILHYYNNLRGQQKEKK